MTRFVDKLRAAQDQRNSWLCIGLDPSPELMPPGVDLLSFCTRMVDATHDVACAYKLNLAFYLAWGVEGLRALQALCAHIPDDVPVVLDAKFGDIGYTAGHYVKAAYEVLRADAVTVSPYVGMDAVTPFIADHPDKLVFVLVRSSNTTGNDFQLWPSERAPLYRYVTAQINTLAREYPEQIGLGVASTHPRDLARIRSWAPSLPFLVPGLGEQEGELHTAVAHGCTRTGMGPLISVTRSIIYASQAGDFETAARAAAQDWAAQIRQLRDLNPAVSC